MDKYENKSEEFDFNDEPEVVQNDPVDDVLVEAPLEDAVEPAAPADEVVIDASVGDDEPEFVERANADAPEEFDPDVAPANAVVDAADVSGILPEAASIAHGDDVEELSENIDIQPTVDTEQVKMMNEYESAQKAAGRRKRLRTTLIVCIVVFVLLGVGLGAFVFINGSSSSGAQYNTMQPANSNSSEEIFSPVDAAVLPKLVSYFGMTPEEAAAASDNAIALDAQATPATDESLPALKSLRNGWMANKAGEISTNITFGLDQDNKIIYALATFDLDALGVASASFEKFASSAIVPSSILVGIGVDQGTIDQAQISIIENSGAVTARDSSAKEIAEFSGSTNRDAAPKAWKLVEVYDHTVGTQVGDNSVIRTISVDLR